MKGNSKKNIPNPNTISITGIKIGDNTHHQDHVICPVSFKVIKMRASIGRKGKVISLFDDSAITLFYL